MLPDSDICCGCGACEQICPKSAIHMVMDQYGFFQPQILDEKCIGCGKCDKACPVLNRSDNPELNIIKEKRTYAFRLENSTSLAQSTSGGFAYALSRLFLEAGGIVFGAVYDENLKVVHRAITTFSDLGKLQGSKYVQSDLQDSLKNIKELLKNKEKVLFIGTPCQVEALHCYLNHHYENLLTVDLICHGVPSPGLWADYVRYKHWTKAKNIVFRGKNKGAGWEKNPRFQVLLKHWKFNMKFHHDQYCKAFINNYSLRKSCFHCRFKNEERHSDFTIGDLWGIHEILPDCHDDCGMSVVFVNTPRGNLLLEDLAKENWVLPISFEKAIKNNMSLYQSTCLNEDIRDRFFEDYARLPLKIVLKKWIIPEPFLLRIKKILYPVKQFLITGIMKQ